MNWSELAFLIGNVVGIVIKRLPNTTAIFKDKLIPVWIFVAMLVTQFIAGLNLNPVSEAGAATLAGFSFAGLGSALWAAFIDTAKAVLLHQLTKQARKPE